MNTRSRREDKPPGVNFDVMVTSLKCDWMTK